MKKHLADVPTRILQYQLRILKAEHAADEAKRIQDNRVHVDVLAQGALLAQDSTHTGNCQNRKAWSEVLKDAATTEAWAFGDGWPVTGESMLGYLEDLKARGLLPLVWAVDNGPANRDKRVQAFMAREQVVILYSRPRTPQDNARAERGIGEGKALAGLGKGVRLENRQLGVQLLDQALQRLNQHWPRRSKGYLTALQLKQILPHWKEATSRTEFYRAACAEIAAIKADNKLALRKETREAIFRTLEQFGLILRTRGERRDPYVKQDAIS